MRLSRLPRTMNTAKSLAHRVREIYRGHFTPPLIRVAPRPRRYKVSPAASSSSSGTTVNTITSLPLSPRGTAGGDKSCDRNDSAKLLLARIRAGSLSCGSLHGRKSGAQGESPTRGGYPRPSPTTPVAVVEDRRQPARGNVRHER